VYGRQPEIKAQSIGDIKLMKFSTNPILHYHLTLGMLLHYLEKLKIQMFCIYSADVEENANILHFKCTDFTARAYGSRNSLHLSVCPSVSLSVTRVDCDKTK